VKVNRRLVAVLGVLVSATACGGGGEEAGLPATWVRADEASFAVEHPKGWSAASHSRLGQITVSGPEGEQVVIRPLFVAAPLEQSAASALLTDLAPAASPDVRWDEPVPSDGAVRMEGGSASTRAVAVLSWTTSPKGTAGYLYVASAPRSAWVAAEGILARVLGSFEARGREVEEAQRPEYVRWEDPKEGAFSVEIPKGWRTTGGTVRPSTVLVQAEVEGTSPDGAVSVSMGDHYPVFVEPNSALSFAGIGEGGTYVDPSGYPSTVATYAPGAEFLTRYVLPDRAPGFEVTSGRDRSDLAGSLPTAGINRYDAGEVEYRFQRGGEEYRGVALAVTEIISAGGFANWHAWRVYRAEAPANRYGEATAALLHLAETFAIDPQWAQGQARLTAQQSQIIADMGEAVSDTLSEAYSGRQAVLDELDRRRSNATLEVEDVFDEATGGTLKVESGSDYYWIDPRGTIVGTDIGTRPDLDFRELIRLG
jgi:hypothetical protein